MIFCGTLSNNPTGIYLNTRLHSTSHRFDTSLLCEQSLVNSSPAQEGEPLQHEAACLLHALRIGAPVLQAVVGEVPQDVQTLTGGNVPVSALLDLREQPRLDQRAPIKQEVVISEQTQMVQSKQKRADSPRHHDPRHSRLSGLHGVFIRQDISVTCGRNRVKASEVWSIFIIRRRQCIYRTAVQELRVWSRCRYTPSQLTLCNAAPVICRAAAEENTFSDLSG